MRMLNSGRRKQESSFVNGMVIYVAFPALALLASPDLPAIMGKRWLTTALISSILQERRGGAYTAIGAGMLHSPQ